MRIVLPDFSRKKSPRDMANRARAQVEQEIIIRGRRGNLWMSSGPRRDVPRLKIPIPRFNQVAAPFEKPAFVRIESE